MRVGIINLAFGYAGALLSALRFYKFNVSVVESISEVDSSDVIVLTGLGSFASGVSSLHSKGLWARLQKAGEMENKPFLGINLGMHLLASEGHENRKEKGLSLIPGKIMKLDNRFKTPHIGWTEVQTADASLFKGIRHESFYFIHSCHFVPVNPGAIVANIKHGSGIIAAAVRLGNKVGLQFNPEKSQGDGLRILRNIMEEFACNVRG